MSRWMVREVLLLSLLLPGIAAAETALFEIYFLPLHEAREIVKSQLSQSGTIAVLPSRQILVVNDDTGHIEQAKKLLKRLDVAAPQYQIYLEPFSLNDNQARSIRTTTHLPGGWIRIVLAGSNQQTSIRKQFSLRLTSYQQGTVETGIIQPSRRQTRQWLAGYGVINAHSVELIPITSGFHATVEPAGEGMVNVCIVPWMRSQRGPNGIKGNTEILIDLGATQMTIPVGETVAIAASSEEAELFGDALLSSDSFTGKKCFAIRLQVKKR